MNQEQNNLNPNNFNTQGNNGTPNNQPLNNQSFNQGMSFNQQPINPQPQQTPSFQQPINQMNMQQPTPQPINNTFESGNASNQSFNSKPPKKMNLGLIIGIVAAVVVIGVGALLLFNKPASQANNNGTTNNNANVVYNDNSRNIKSTYTFDEATSQFAFKEYETTLIFKQTDKVKFSAISFKPLSNVISFYYEKNDSTHFNFQFEESNSTNVSEFVNNFNNGILGGGKKQLSFENIKIIESNDEYAFISCQQSGNSSYNYYFAKQIGNKVFYAHYNSLFEVDDAEKVGYQVAIDRGKSEMLIGFKELFSTLSTDDNKEPYISDKILNVPVVLDKQINGYELISNIQLVHPKSSTANYRNYMKGSVSLSTEESKSIVVEYDAEKLFNKIEWNENLNSKLKYSKEDNYFGVKDNNIIQMFKISTSENINGEKSFNEYLNNFFINK